MEILELKKRLRYDPETGVLTRRAGYVGIKAGAVVGTLTTEGGLQATFLGRRYQVSHLVLAMATGALPDPDNVVIHINKDIQDNRLENLKEVTKCYLQAMRF